MSKLEQLLKDRETLEQAIRAARQEEITEALQTVRALVVKFELTPQDVFPPVRGRSAGAGSAGSTGAKVAPKYRDPATGKTWTGRGKPPEWIRDKDRAQFAI